MGAFHLILIWSLSVSTASGRPGRPGTSLTQFLFHKQLYTYSCQLIYQHYFLFIKFLLNYNQFVMPIYFLWFCFQFSQIIWLNTEVLAFLICTGVLISNPIQDISHLDTDILWSYSASPKNAVTVS
jgi:hypothetical protein